MLSPRTTRGRSCPVEVNGTATAPCCQMTTETRNPNAGTYCSVGDVILQRSDSGPATKSFVAGARLALTTTVRADTQTSRSYTARSGRLVWVASLVAASTHERPADEPLRIRRREPMDPYAGLSEYRDTQEIRHDTRSR